MNEYVSWQTLSTFGGCLTMVMLLTQFTKGLPVFEKIPTQILSYILALLVMYPAMYFTNQLTAGTAVSNIFNGIIVSLAANGGYHAIKKLSDSSQT